MSPTTGTRAFGPARSKISLAHWLAWKCLPLTLGFAMQVQQYLFSFIFVVAAFCVVAFIFVVTAGA